MTEAPTDTPQPARRNDLNDPAMVSAKRRPFRLGLLMMALVLIADQVTKYWIVEVVMQPPRIIPVTSFFNLVMGWNPGVSFGLFDEHGGDGVAILVGVAVCVVIALAVWLWKVREAHIGIAIGLIIGGALGNVIDRLRFGAVADFLDFHVAGWHWPAFNVADSGITLGACLIVVDALLLRERSR